MAVKYINASLKQASDDCFRLGNPYAHLDDSGIRAAIIPCSGLASVHRKATVRQITSDVKEKAVTDDKNYPDLDENCVSRDDVIERKVSELHKMIWSKRNELCADGEFVDPVELLEPVKVLELLGYRVVFEETLGVFQERKTEIDVAGLLDRKKHRICISRRFRPNVRRFTLAHELGHALMHEDTTILHRDKALDGSRVARDKVEVEADKFAALFLMPKNLVISRFNKAFCVNGQFVPTTNAVFAFAQEDVIESIEGCETIRELARILAKTERYNGKSFTSLAAQFHVTVEAMAIRLEELGLICLHDDLDMF